MAKKSDPIPAAPKVKHVPKVTVLERRLQNPFGDGSQAIKLKEPAWALHIFDTSRPGRFHYAKREKGWEPVLPEDLDGTAEDLGFDIVDGRVVRGERGKEVLMKMPQDMYDKIALRKAEVTTPYNNYNSMTEPMRKWHEEKGVDFQMKRKVVDMDFNPSQDKLTVERLHYTTNDEDDVTIDVRDRDFVFATTGSMIADYTRTRMPYFLPSSARQRVKPAIPAFAAP